MYNHCLSLHPIMRLRNRRDAGGIRPYSTMRYEICVKGHLDSRWGTMFEGFTFTHTFMPDQQPITVMAGQIIDPAALYGILSRLRNLGVALVSVKPQE